MTIFVTPTAIVPKNNQNSCWEPANMENRKKVHWSTALKGTYAVETIPVNVKCVMEKHKRFRSTFE